MVKSVVECLWQHHVRSKWLLHFCQFTLFFLSYFVSLPSMLEMIGGPPSDHPEAFAWMAGMSIVLYFNFAWFREQLCIVICPYGRLQGVLYDRMVVVQYILDRKREIELRPGGASLPVRWGDRRAWADLAVKSRVEEMREQVDALRRGIGKVVPLGLLRLHDLIQAGLA